jgi:hypothetical protein
MTINSTLGPNGYEVSIPAPVSGGGTVNDAREATLAVCGVSIERQGFSDIGKRLDCTAGSWSNGVVSLTSTSHGVTVGTVVPVDAYDYSGGSYGALGVSATFTDANTLTYPLAANPGAISGTVAVDFRVDRGIPITSATWSGGTATITLPIPLGLNVLPAGDYRVSMSGATDASGNALDEYNAVAACAPTAFSATNILTIYNTADPGAAAAGGTLTFIPQYLAGAGGWIHDLNRLLGAPFKFVANFATGGATPVAVAKQVDQVLAMPTKPTHCLIGGVENDSTITAVEIFRTAVRRLIAANIVPILFDARPAALFSTSTNQFDAYQRDLADMAAAEGVVLLTGGDAYQRPGTAPLVDAYADAAWRLAPPSTDNTHPSRRGRAELAASLAKSDGADRLRRLARRQRGMLGGGLKGNLLPNPQFLTATGGSLGGGTGTVPGSYEIYGDNTSCVCVPIKRAYPRKWLAGMVAAIGDVAFALTRSSQWLFVATTAGTAAGSEPTWPTSHGGTVVDGGVTWRAISPDCCDGAPGYWLQVTVPRPTSLAITGVTQANPGVVTVGAVTGLANNRRIYIDGVAGMTQLNGRIWSMSGLGASTFNLLRDDTNGATNTTAFGAYSAGGVVLPFTGIGFSLATALAKSGGGWATGDRLRYSCEIVCEDVDVMRGVAFQAGFTAATMNSDAIFSTSASQGIALPSQTYSVDFMAPRPASAAAQTLDPTLTVGLLSGTFRLGSPRLENRGPW